MTGEQIREIFKINSDIYISRRRKHEHLVFNQSFISLKDHEKILNFVYLQWEYKYKLVFLRLIHSAKWRYDYVFFRNIKNYYYYFLILSLIMFRTIIINYNNENSLRSD